MGETSYRLLLSREKVCLLIEGIREKVLVVLKEIENGFVEIGKW